MKKRNDSNLEIVIDTKEGEQLNFILSRRVVLNLAESDHKQIHFDFLKDNTCRMIYTNNFKSKDNKELTIISVKLREKNG